MPAHSPSPPPAARHRPASTADIRVLDDAEPAAIQARSGLYLALQACFFVSLTVAVLLLLNLVLDLPRCTVHSLSLNHGAAAFTTYIGMLSTALVPSLVVLGLSLLALSWEDRLVGALVFATGLLAHLGLPWLIFAVVGRSPATAAVAQGFRAAGWALTLMGLAKLAFDVVLGFRVSSHRLRSGAQVGFSARASRNSLAAAHPTVFSPCWQLPFCRDIIRQSCPAWLQRTKCWKFGRGCYCDDSMITALIAGELTGVARPAVRRLPSGKPPCRRCYIYMEHQSLKLSWTSPLALPLAVGFTFAIWPLYTALWHGANHVLAGLWAHTAYTPIAPEGPPPLHPVTPMGQLQPEQVAAIAQNLFGLVFGFFLLIALLRAIEHAIEKLGW